MKYFFILFKSTCNFGIHASSNLLKMRVSVNKFSRTPNFYDNFSKGLSVLKNYEISVQSFLHSCLIKEDIKVPGTLIESIKKI